MRERSTTGLAVRRVVHLEDQRRTGGDALRRSRQIHRRILTHRPVDEHRITAAGRRRSRRALFAGRTGRSGGEQPAPPDRIGLIATTFGRLRRLRFTHVDDDVMHVRAIARTHFTGLHPLVLGEVGRDLEVLVVDRSRRRHLIVGLHLEHVIGLPNLPAIGELRQRRKLGRIALAGARLDPRGDRVDLSLREAQIVSERSVLAIRMPRWHDARGDFLADRARPRTHIAIGDERHRCDLAWPMTAHALVIEDRGYVAAEGGSRLRRGVLRGRISGENQPTGAPDTQCRDEDDGAKLVRSHELLRAKGQQHVTGSPAERPVS